MWWSSLAQSLFSDTRAEGGSIQKGETAQDQGKKKNASSIKFKRKGCKPQINICSTLAVIIKLEK